MRSLIVAVALYVAVVALAMFPLKSIVAVASPASNSCLNAKPVPKALRLPAVVPPGEPVAIERQMLSYLESYAYRGLDWCHDKSIRDTGPFINGVSYGTHPAVRIYYSPEVIAWLRNGRTGAIPDGAVIIKEQYGGGKLPAEAFANSDLPKDWTIMIRRASGSHDGWFWAELYDNMFRDETRLSYPWAGYGLYCVRCHASAARSGTFASLENIAGFPGEPIRYRVDDSWRNVHSPHGASAQAAKISEIPLAVQTFPPEPLDTVVPPPGHPFFITSNQCMSCHGAQFAPFGPTMWLGGAPNATVPGINVSEYGEWRWSPMALAGRDPVFYAQVESELASLDFMNDAHAQRAMSETIVDTCLTCHGVMGERSFMRDHPKGTFSLAFIYDAIPEHEGFRYGALARDGVSCAACHRMSAPAPKPGSDELADFLEHKTTGRFDLGPPDRMIGPFDDKAIVTHTMEGAIGAKPVFSKFSMSSQMCGSCHTVVLPVIDATPHREVEQATYLEWLNSAYQDEYGSHPGAQSCQDCHMPAGVKDRARGIELTHIATRIALTQDDTYPQTTDAAPRDEIHVRKREQGFRRHELLGLNAFLLTVVKQFPDVIGVRTSDYMSGSTNDLDEAIAHVVQQARERTAKVSVRTRIEGDTLIADVEVTNLAGHRFPTGVGFRRAFLDVELHDTTQPGDAGLIFASGRTDAHGRIIDRTGTPLPSESFARDARGRQSYQDHFDVAHPITNSGEAEIFEELAQDRSGTFTTSFLRLDHIVKDNRLLPRGWRSSGPPHPVPEFYLHATYPKGRAASDPSYRDGLGHAIVRYVIPLPRGADIRSLALTASLYYQSWAPYFVAQRRAVKGSASSRFAALIDHLDLRSTPLDDWKLLITRTSSVIAPQTSVRHTRMPATASAASVSGAG